MCKTLAAAWLLLGAVALPASAQVTTGTITGSVTDAQGAVVPGATVVLTNETLGTKAPPIVTNEQGSYTLPGVAAGRYSIEVTMPSFNTQTRKGVQVNGGDRVAVETMVLQVSGTAETVNVRAEAPVIQAASGERSSAMQTVQLEHLPVASHNFMDFAMIQPGLNTQLGSNPGSQSRRTGGGGQDNVMLDGISALDSGNNGVMSGMNLQQDAILEVKVLTSGYAAEYGRSSGVQITAVTRGGTNRFSGGFYDYERNSDWNSNTWANTQNGTAKTISKQRDIGYSIGGPVGKPGGSNKLFFFYTQEFRPRTSGSTPTNYRLPTALERVGDFSQTLDNNGNLYNAIYDASTGLPKTSCVQGGVTTACFQDGGVLGKIPVNKLYGPGLALLNEFPLPDRTQTTGSSLNFVSPAVVQKQLSYSPVARIDYQASSKLRLTAKLSAASARILPALGNLPGFTDQIQNFPLSFNTAVTANYVISPTTFLEATYGFNQNRLGTPSVSPLSNRNNVVCPSGLAAQVKNCTLGAIPFLFPDAGKLNPDFYETGALNTIGVPFVENNTSLLPPQFQWGTTRLSNAPPSINYPGFMNINQIQQSAVSVTRVMGNHTAKAGLYFEHSYKAQNTGGNLSFQGVLNFQVDTGNPLDTQFPFSNAAIGTYSSYGQGSQFIEGNFFYNNIEWYVQDNWKVNRKLTLDYGLRFAHDGPYEDKFKQVANFFPDQYARANAPVLYTPGCVGGVNPCTGNNRQAVDPRTGALLGVGSASLIGAEIVGTGNIANGLRRAGDGISNAGYTWPGLAVAPRFGMAYDVTGGQKLILRGSLGLYFDRPDGNTAFGTVANPPTATGLTQQWGLLSDLGNSQFKLGPVPNIVVNQYDSAIPKDWQWNFGGQLALPWSSLLDVSYVGHHQYDSLAGTQNGAQTNYNAIDLGTTLTAAGQDPTQAAGTALNSNLLRAFRGYGNINVQTSQWSRTYHSVQMSLLRRFNHGFSFGVSDTWTLYDKGNTNLPGPQLRINHNPDGSFYVRDDQAQAEKLFGFQGTPTHISNTNFVWDLPDVKGNNMAVKGLGLLLNDWQLSGIMRIDSGQKYDLSYSYNTGPTGQALTGSPDYNARIVYLGSAGDGCSSNQYAQFNNKLVAVSGGASPLMSTVVAGPQVGSNGLESGRNLLTACGDHRLDLAIQRTINLGGGRTVEVRADVYNVFNEVIFNARQGQIQLNSITDQTVRNSQFLVDGSVDTTRLQPNNAGFGAATGAMNVSLGGTPTMNANRAVQVQARFRF